VPLFEIRPSADTSPHYVITYIEPVEVNGPAVGLNIAFEPNRLHAAELSRDSGKPAITRRVVLVQDEQKTTGFLLLYPIYRDGAPTATVADRRAALRGWIYAPFIAKNLFNDLSVGAGRTHTLKIYDGTEERPDALIYSDAVERSSAPTYTLREHLHVMQQDWLVVWESTPAFERREQTNAPLYILIGGLLFTMLFALFLVGMTLHRRDAIEWMAGEGKYALSAGVFLLLAVGSYAAFRSLQQAELAHVRERVQDEVAKVGLLLSSQADDRLLALKRMAQRWHAAGGTPQPLWQADARNYIKQLSGLKALEWVDPTHHIRWVEPLAGNEHVIGLDILFDASGTGAPKHTPSKEAPTVTPPLDLAQGYTAFLAYQPVFVGERFDGFLVGVFAIDDFFRSAISGETTDAYALTVEYEGKTYFSNGVPPNLQEREFGTEHRFLLNDKQWVLRLVPTRELIASQRGALPIAVLIAGMLIAVLSAISLRYILVSRLKSAHLAESSSLNAAILASTPYLVIATDQQGKVITFNQTAEEALGYAAHEVVGRETPSLWHDPEEVTARAAALSEELHEPVPLGFEVLVSKSRRQGIDSSEWTFIRKDGSRFPGNLTVTTLRDRRGAPTGYLGVVEDITERRRQQQALRTSEETFRTAMEFAPIGQVLIAPDGRWLKVNPALCRLLGYSEEELLAGRLQWLTRSDAEDSAQMVRKLQTDQVQTCQLEKVFQRRDGRVISMLLSMSLVRRGDSQPDYLIAQVQDITERKEMERLKNEFISVVSHELRTPLTSIRGSLGLLLGVFTQELPQKVRSLIEIAYNNCERLIPLINDILDIDKIASGHMRFEMQEESVAVLTMQAVQANEAYARKFDVTIAVAPIDEKLRVVVDAARYQQVLSNLLSNASKFSPPGGVIEVSAEARDGRVSIAVRDYGEGISEEFQPRIFSKFSQADSSATRAKGGTGLGLHIARQLVEQMQGTIEFTTMVGKGTTFRVEFPLVAKTPRHDPSTVLHFRERKQAGADVLHVEDDADLGNLVATALQGKATTFTATSLAEAESLLAKKTFSMILLDMKLPDGSGVELLERMRELSDPPPPVVILAADEPPADVSDKAAAVMVKTRTSEAVVVQTVLDVLQQVRDEKEAGSDAPLAT
jgi:PAS domain S-box-containing protein